MISSIDFSELYAIDECLEWDNNDKKTNISQQFLQNPPVIDL